MDSETKHYVAGLLFGDIRSKVLLIRKSHPYWMKGKLNGIGGHVKPCEPMEFAMYREFIEETGIIISHWHWKPFATITSNEDNGKTCIVHWYTMAIKESKNCQPVQRDNKGNISQNEPVAWFDVESVTRGLHGNMLPDLCWLIYMAKARIEGTNRDLIYQIHESYA